MASTRTILQRELFEQGVTVRELTKSINSKHESQVSAIVSGRLSCPERLRKPICAFLALDPERTWDVLGRARLEGER